MEIILTLLNVIQFLLLTYFGTASLYMLFFSVTAKFGVPIKLRSKTNGNFLVLIPSYKEDEVIVSTAAKALQQKYPVDLFDVVVIADSLKSNTLNELSKLSIETIVVHFEKSTKSKSINYALQHLKQDYDYIVILDADNEMEEEFLLKMNDSLQSGSLAVQGRRIAKNTNTSFAILDAISESINNNIYNLGHRNASLSSRLVGSGMAFDFRTFVPIMSTIDAVGGFDKELELKLLEKKIFIDYRHDAILVDEKVQKAEVFEKQRKRWLAAQYHYFSIYFPKACRDLILKGNFDFFNKAYQMMLPPRLLIPVVLFIGTVISFALSHPYSFLWTFALIANIIANSISISKDLFNIKMITAFINLPKALLKTLSAIFRLRGANKTFIHTPHQKIQS